MHTKVRKKVLTLTKKDFVIDTFRGSGPGGQHRNKTDSAVRITHPPSGAVAVAQNQRSQHANKKIAFKRLGESKKFKDWVHITVSRQAVTMAEIEKKVDASMSPSNIIVEEYRDGKWLVV